MIPGGGVPLWVALVSGLVAFLSACVLPIVPPYLALVAGSFFAPRRSSDPTRAALRFGAIFLLGFVILFVLAGSTATPVGSWMRGMLTPVERVGGSLMLFAGVYLILAARQRRIAPPPVGLPEGFALILGAGFAAAWTPCIGPVLAEILLYAAFPETVAEGALLLTVYTFGLVLPFFALAVLSLWLLRRVFHDTRQGKWPAVASGLFIVVIAVLLLSGRMARLTAFLSAFGPMIELDL